MKIHPRSRAFLTTVLLMLAAAPLARPQAIDTASRRFELSAFGLGTGTYTGIESSKNLAFTAGFNIAFHPLGPIRPEIELRGTEPVDGGQIVAEKDFLAGLKFSTWVNRPLHPYVDFFYGRGEMHYAGAGLQIGNVLYQYTSSGIYAAGGGLDYDLTQHFAVKADVQIQDWKTPVTTTGTAHPTSISVGLIYRINTSRMPDTGVKHSKHDRNPPPEPPAPPPSPAVTASPATTSPAPATSAPATSPAPPTANAAPPASAPAPAPTAP